MAELNDAQRSTLGFMLIRQVGGINLLVTGQTVIVSAVAGRKFFPLQVHIRVTALTGSIVTPPIVRLGNSGSFNNVTPLFTVVAAAVDAIDLIPSVAALTAVDIGTIPVSLDVQTAAVGPSVMAAEIYVRGHLI